MTIRLLIGSTVTNATLHTTQDVSWPARAPP